MKTLIVAGGSGGHLIPALALAEHLTNLGPCLILSTTRPVDRTVASVSSVEWMTVEFQQWMPLHRWLSPRYTAHQFGAVRQVWSILHQVQPDVVVGFGGYFSAIGVTAARLGGFPAVVHEQNFLPGRANRWLSPLVNAVAVTFPETKNYLSSRSVVEVTGNPIRINKQPIHPEEARSSFGFDLVRPVLLVMGGSQGAQSINRLSLSAFESLSPADRGGLQVLHLAGSRDASYVEAAYRRLGIDARVFSFFHEMHRAYRAATLAISRAGATTIAELISSELPSILIPYPYAGGHQWANAHWIHVSGGAILIEEQSLTPEILWRSVQALLSDSGRLTAMRTALHAQADGSATERLGSLIRKVVMGTGGS